MVTLQARKEQFLAKSFKKYEEGLYEVKKNLKNIIAGSSIEYYYMASLQCRLIHLHG